MINIRLYRVLTQVAIEVSYGGTSSSDPASPVPMSPVLVGRVYREPPGDEVDPYWLGETLGDLLRDVEHYEAMQIDGYL